MTTKVRERPILFSGEMVRAILAGRKTQTRRVVRFPSWLADADGGQESCIPYQGDGFMDTRLITAGDVLLHCTCPYGEPGDRLWVREKWWLVEVHGQGIGNAFVVYDDEIVDGMPQPKALRPWPNEVRRFGCHPSIHMPRWASRITLEVTGVRVERLNEITIQDVYAEGLEPQETADVALNCGARFKRLWDQINAKRGYPWESNPWVWVVDFKQCDDEDLEDDDDFRDGVGM